MKKTMRIFCGFWFLVLSLASESAVQKIYVFGDSFSDGGSSPTVKYSLHNDNFEQYKLLMGQIPHSCGFQNRFTNGLTTVEFAAAMLGKADVNDFENYAVAGSDSRAFADQVAKFNALRKESGSRLSAEDLIIVGFGSNDINNVLNGSLMQEDGNPHTAESLKIKIWENIRTELDGFANKGARQFVIIGQPDLLKKPALLNGYLKDYHPIIAQFVVDFNGYLKDQIAVYQAMHNIKIVYFDLYAAESQLYSDYASLKSANNSVKAPNGIELFYVYNAYNAVNECAEYVRKYAPADTASEWDKKVFYYGVSSRPSYDRFLYWDGLHWSKRAHVYFGSHLANLINLHFN